MARLAEANHVEPGEVGCDGCLSNRLMPECRQCRHGFRACARARGVTWCFQCDDFPCQRLRGFLPIHIRDGVSHHARLLNELRDMGQRGVNAWLEDKATQAACPNCGRSLYWFERVCPDCGAKK